MTLEAVDIACLLFYLFANISRLPNHLISNETMKHLKKVERFEKMILLFMTSS